MIEPMYRVELVPMQTNGGNVAHIAANGRVIECYRGSYIGCFGLSPENPWIFVVIREWKEVKYLDIDRQDEAVREIWETYFKSLSPRERFSRRIFSHRAWLATFVTSLISSVLASTLALMVSDRYEALTRGPERPSFEAVVPATPALDHRQH